jgi:hypothetical protein
MICVIVLVFMLFLISLSMYLVSLEETNKAWTDENVRNSDKLSITTFVLFMIFLVLSLVEIIV